MNKTDSKSPKFRRRAEARPDEVLDAALALFTEQGYARTTVDQVARRAGFSKGTVYLYFSSKEAILEGLVRRAVEPIAEASFDRMADYRGDPRPLLATFVQTVAQTLSSGDYRTVPLIILREAPAAPGIAALFRNAVLDRALPAMIGLLEQGVAGGHIRAVDPELTARSVIGPVMVHLLLSEVFDIRPDGGMEMERLVENHLSILFAGLEPEGTT
ncbi:TetR/AcrR family transcriptional regulator [Pseudooceanicola sp. LIPI14-2-Ac024]|uniref:TetR/AcrR family transcriptional regulator n=1 Tax=Pseudooceanicola sp. LIPI14-2-Ac024 TaxID=3344875 RepID=UPI0035D0F5EC